MPTEIVVERGNLRRVGWILIAVGVISILLPTLATLALELTLGAVLLVAGVGQVGLTLRAKTDRPFAWRLAIGMLHIVVGLMLLTNPFSGAVAMSLVLGILFLLEGIWEAAIAMKVRPARGWSWLMASAAISGLLGLLILANWPGDAAWMIGVFVGINLIVSGWAAVVITSDGATPSA